MITLTPADGPNIDNTGLLLQAIDDAKAKGEPLWIQPGVFAYSDILTLDGVTMYGEGTLYALNPLRSAIFLKGKGAALHDVKLSGPPPPARGTTRESCRVVAFEAEDWMVTGVTVDSCAGAGIRADSSRHGTISYNRITGTLADAIHNTDCTSDMLIEDNTIERPGDDGIACVSYQGQGGYVERVTARRNRISANVGGRSMSVVGGRDITYELNMLEDNPNAAGVYIAQEDAYKTYGAHDVRIRRNSIHNCGGVAKDHTAVLIFSGKFEVNTGITVERNVIVFDVKNVGGIRDYSQDTGCVFDSNVMMGCTPNYRINHPELFTVIPYTSGPVGVM